MKIGLGYIPETSDLDEVVNTKICFQPFINFLETCLASEQTPKAKLYKFVLDEFNKAPMPGDFIEFDELPDHAELLELIYMILSPPTANEKEFLWALSAPGSKYLFYRTEAFDQTVESGTSGETGARFASEEKEFIKKCLRTSAYKIILEKFYNLDSVELDRIIYSHFDLTRGLTRYYQVGRDTRFIRISYKDTLPALDCETPEKYIRNGHPTEYLQEILPLSNFCFTGFTVVTLEDVTNEYATEIVKRALISTIESEEARFESVRYGLKLLGSNKDIDFGLLPFVSVNNMLVFDHGECTRSVLLTVAGQSEEIMASVYAAAEKYREHPELKIYSTGHDVKTLSVHIRALFDAGVGSYCIAPVYYNQSLVGVLEIYSNSADIYYKHIISRINNALPLVAQLLQNSIDRFEENINNIIRDKFTALQPAVQWKFNNVALDYYRGVHAGQNNPAIGTIAFESVYPLYGMLDIRNSTIERNQALARDIDNLLLLLHHDEHDICHLVDENKTSAVQNEFSRWYAAVADFCNSGDSGLLNLFLQMEVIPWLSRLMATNPEVYEPVSRLKRILQKDGIEISENRNRLELAFQKINKALNDFFSNERQTLMSIYPCYFETFRTDGVEYDLYVGQSISVLGVFLPEHLQAFRLWQLRSMIQATAITKSALDEHDLQLVTTQLIYINPHPINISFRNDERHFDVDGGYNIRYQIIKKRIDKVHIRNTNERLTQPGKIAIVYYNEADITNYLVYVKTMQQEGLLQAEIENLELEELQGIYGLKAIRVSVQ